MPDNFNIAREASNYVRQQMQVKAANREADNVSAVDFDAAEQTKIPYEDLLSEAGIVENTLIDCLAWATVAQRSHIGNCIAMASLAFAWIAFTYPNARPVGIYGFTGSTSDADGGLATITKRTMAVTGKPLEMNQEVVKILDGVRTATPVFSADHAICIVGDPKLVMGEVTAAGSYVCDPWARRVYDSTSIKIESELLARVTGGSTKLSSMAKLDAGHTLSPRVKEIIGIPQ
jgi:hypothetical protein